MKINRNNYEIFFVDYSDGKLSENQIENLMAFISLNPDLEEEFYTFINLEKLPENNIDIDLKFSLKKNVNDFIITKENFENCCIAKIEGDLSKQEEETFDKYIDINQTKKIDFEFYKKTILHEDAKIQYNEKSELKRTEKYFIITDKNFDECAIAVIEGGLSTEESLIFNKYISLNPEKEKDFILFQKTVLQAENSVIFEDKTKLKKYFIGKRKSRNTIYQIIANVAAIFLVVAIFLNIGNNESVKILKNNRNIANNKNVKEVYSSSKENFSIIKTETPSIVSKSTSKDNNKKTNRYQYVDPQKAIFISDIIIGISKYSTGDNEDLIIKSNKDIQTAGLINKNTIAENNILSDNKLNVSYISPKNISMMSGELNNDNYLNSILDNIDMSIKEKQSSQHNNKLTFWDVAETGLKGYGKLTGKKVMWDKEYNNNGEIASINVNTSKFSFSRNLKNK